MRLEIWLTPTSGLQHRDITANMANHHVRTGGQGNLMEQAGAFMERLFDVETENDSPSSRQVSRANPSQLVASVRELMTSVTSGQKSGEPFAKLAPDGSWVKTSEESSLFPEEEFSVPFSQTWPAWGLVLDGCAMELTRPRGLPTDETECSLWPTSRTADVYLWPTAQAMDASPRRSVQERALTPEQQRKRGGGARNLNEWAETFSIPQGPETGMDGSDCSQPGQTSHQPCQPDLPTMRELCASLLQGETNESDDETLERLRRFCERVRPPKRRLNLKFVQQLMGFPEGWV